MKHQSLLLALIILFATSANAQKDTTAKYPNGNYILRTGSTYELHRKGDPAILAVWNSSNDIEPGKDRKDYSKIHFGNGIQRKTGLLNKGEGNLLLPLAYSQIQTGLVENIMILVRDSLYGLYNLKNHRLIEPVYSFIYRHVNLHQMLASAKLGLLIIDTSLKIIDTAIGFTKVLGGTYTKRSKYVVMEGDKGQGFLSTENKIIYYKGWKKILSLQDSSVLVYNGSKYAVYDLKKNKYIKPFVFEKMVNDKYMEDVFLAEKGKWSILTTKGDLILKFSADTVAFAYHRSAFFFKRNNLWGIMDINGKILQEPIWKKLAFASFRVFHAATDDKDFQKYQFEYSDKEPYNVIRVKQYIEPDKIAPLQQDVILEEDFTKVNHRIDAGPIPEVNKTDDENKIFERMEINPEIAGIKVSEKEYLKQAIEDYRNKNKIKAKGKVIIRLVIAKDGSVEQTQVQQSDSTVLMEASKNILKEIKWRPGNQNGRVVRGMKTIQFEW